MLNPQGYVSAAKKPADPDFKTIMKSVKQNITDSESQIEEFIKKETNQQRRQGLEEIFKSAKALKQQFDDHRQADLEKSAVYKEKASELYKKMQKQRHAGRKLFMTCVANPLLGFDSVVFFYYPTIRGIKSNSLELMDDFIENLKGIKSEYVPETKPFTIGMMNVPKSESYRQSAGKSKCKKIKIKHADLKNDIAASIASVIMTHNVPVKWLDHNIDTSEVPNMFRKKANILINCSLVVEMTEEPLQTADSIPDNDYDWSSNGSFEVEANKMIAKSRNESQSKTVQSLKNQNQTFERFSGDDDFMEIEYQPYISVSTAGLEPEPHCLGIPTDSGIGIITAVASTPIGKKSGIENLPKPNDSLLSIGLPEEIENIEKIRTAPLTTPKIKRRSLGRSNTLAPATMAPLESDSEDDIPLNASAPVMGNDDKKIASQKDLDTMLQHINDKFAMLEKSINKN